MKIKSNLKTYLPFAINVFQRKLSYRADAIIFVLGNAVMLGVTYYLWKAVYGSSTSKMINEFTLDEMTIYTSIKLAVSSIAFWIKFAQSYLFMTYSLSLFSCLSNLFFLPIFILPIILTMQS